MTKVTRFSDSDNGTDERPNDTARTCVDGQFTLFDLSGVDMPRPAPLTEKPRSGYIRVSTATGKLLLCAIDVVMWVKDEGYETARMSWADAKRLRNSESDQPLGSFQQLKAKAPDGKMRETDLIDQEQFYRLAFDLPGKKAARFKDAAAYMMAQVTVQAQKANQDVTSYIMSGKAASWATQRVQTKQATRDLQRTLFETHVTENPDFGRIFGAQTKTLFAMSKARILQELDLDKRHANDYRDHMGEYAQRAIMDACRAAEGRMRFLNRHLTNDEQIEIVMRASEMAGKAMRQLAEFAGEDYLTGHRMNTPLITQTRMVIPRLPSGKGGAE
jgi:hypothetical protein